jgi:bifunctional N-acetylglucosamine-1-phosphate-uridyltransferase/glucosamine-1-phosphate-acetyltransferase GlmU-like protein
MAEKSEGVKSLEMRVAELEDKLKGLQISEEEMRAYNKVSTMLSGGQGITAEAVDPGGATPAAGCVINQCTIRACTVVQQCTIRACTVVQQCTIRACTIVQQCTVVQQCTIRACTIIQDCINECGGGCAPGGGGFTGGGFGSLGG